MTGGFGVNLDALQTAKDGIDATLAELRDAGLHGSESSGAIVEDWKLDSEDAGHQALADALEEFLDRAHYWLRDLLAGAGRTVYELTETRLTYEQTQHDAIELFRDVWDGATGNPMSQRQLTEDSR